MAEGFTRAPIRLAEVLEVQLPLLRPFVTGFGVTDKRHTVLVQHAQFRQTGYECRLGERFATVVCPDDHGGLILAAWFLRSLDLGAFDAVVIGSDPSFAAVLALPLRAARPRTPILHWCFDVYPDAVEAYLMAQRRDRYPRGLFAKGSDIPRKLMRIVRGGGSVAILADLRDRSGLAVPFFGRPAPSTIFPAQAEQDRLLSETPSSNPRCSSRLTICRTAGRCATT